MRSKTKKSVSRLVGIWTFLLLFIFKGIFPKPAYAFLSSLDACAANPECAAAVSSELAPAVSAPTGAGFGASTLSTTTAAGATTSSVQAVAEMSVAARLGTLGILYYWNQSQNEQAQNKAKQKYCAANPSDSVCGFAWNVTGQGLASGMPSCELSGLFYPRTLYGTSISFSSSTFTDTECQGYYQGCPKDIIVLDGQLSPNDIFAGGTGTITKISDPPPWKDWSQEKRDEAVRLLNGSDWQGLINSMPEAGRLNPGDKINAPTIVIPGEETDDPNTPADERLLKKEHGLFTFPGNPDFDKDGIPDATDSDDDNDGTPDTSDPQPYNPNIPTASGGSPPEPSPSPSPEPYVNNNPRATPDEVRLGEFLDGQAQAGRLPRTARVEGAAEIPNTRSGDYRFVERDNNQISGDLLQPETANTRGIETKIIDKGNQAEVVVVELGLGESGRLGVDEARSIAENVLNTPDHGVNRVIFIKDGQIIVDYSR